MGNKTFGDFHVSLPCYAEQYIRFVNSDETIVELS